MKDNNGQTERWARMYNLLCEFREYHHRWPKANEIYKGIKLGRWCATQRQEATFLNFPADRRQKLVDIGFVFETKDRKTEWDRAYALLCEFYAEHNRWPKLGEHYKGMNLGRWCGYQRQRAKSADYPQNRRQKFEDVGFSCNIRDTAWERMYSLLREFWNEHQRWPKKGEQYHGVKLGAWCANQRYGMSGNDYPFDRKQKLEEIGFKVEVMDRDESWEKMYVLLCEFYAEHQRWPRQDETYHGENLGFWCHNQRQRAKKVGYPADRSKKLAAIGFPLDCRSYKWEKMYTLLIEFFDEHLRWPKQSEQYKGENLGLWCTTQRMAAKKPDYPADRRQKLEDIGFQLRCSLLSENHTEESR